MHPHRVPNPITTDGTNMAQIDFPDGSMIIDDSELMPNFQARKLAADGMTSADIVRELSYAGCSLSDVERWIAQAPYESPETYWMRRYNAGTHMQDDFADDVLEEDEEDDTAE